MAKRVGYRESNNKNGELSVRITDCELVNALRIHCKMTNQQCTTFIENCVRKCLEHAHEEYLLTLSKEDLVNMILNGGDKS